MSSAVNQSEYLAWNGESGNHWIADAERRDRVLRPMTDVLLEMGQLQPGEAVLDIGCGCGALAVAASHLVGSRGSVLGVDISEVMLSVALRRAAELSDSDITFVATDAQTHPFETARYDVALSRFGTMFFDDPVAAFENIAGALRPGGRLCFVTWQPLIGNDWLTIPGAALLAYGELPESEDDRPGMFAQSDPAAVTTLLRNAGYVEISVEAIAVPMTLGADPDEATDYLADSGMGRAVLATMTKEQERAALHAVREVLREHRSSQGVVLGGGILVASAVATRE